MRISDWSSDVCSSDLRLHLVVRGIALQLAHHHPRRTFDLQFDRDPVAHEEIDPFAGPEDEFAPKTDGIALNKGFDILLEQCLVAQETGRASCRDRVSTYVCVSVVAAKIHK